MGEDSKKDDKKDIDKNTDDSGEAPQQSGNGEKGKVKGKNLLNFIYDHPTFVASFLYIIVTIIFGIYNFNSSLTNLPYQTLILLAPKKFFFGVFLLLL